MVTTGKEKLGAVHSWASPRWAHYAGWSLLSLAFCLQLWGMSTRANQLSAIAQPSRTLPELLGMAVVFALGFVVAYLHSYLRKKGENRAAQEDLGKLTKIVEDIRHQNKLAIEQGSRRHQIRLAALERRLVAHQEGYRRWRKLIFLKNPDEIRDFAVECQDWWAANCLFLEAEAREAFFDAILQAPQHADLIRNKAPTEEKVNSWETIRRAGQLLVKAVELPPINADEAEDHPQSE